jgi:hypothetical protein
MALQGDQIGRIFAYRAIVYIGRGGLKITEVKTYFELLFPRYQFVFILSKKRVGLHFGRLIHKLIWPPCMAANQSYFQWLEKNSRRVWASLFQRYLKAGN